MNHERKDIGKMTKLMGFYVVQIFVYSWVFYRFIGHKSFFSEIVVFEVGSMTFYLLLNGFKYSVNYFEFLTFSNYQSWKNQLFLFSDLIIHLVKIVFQIVCLIRFTVFYNYPIFWARDIFLSVMISLEYIKKYLQSIKIIKSLNKLQSISLHDRNEDCGICLQRMKKGSQLPCGHYFHKECLVYAFFTIGTGYISLQMLRSVPFVELTSSWISLKQINKLQD